MRLVKKDMEAVKDAHPNTAAMVRDERLPRARRQLSPSSASRSRLRVGIPRVLNLWSTHQFWIGFLGALGIDAASYRVLVRQLGGSGAASSARDAAPWTAAIR